MSEDESAVLVDWSGAVSARSVPMGNKYRQHSPSARQRNAISLYDSDSSDDEIRKQMKCSSSMMLSKSFHGDEMDDDELDEDDEEVSDVEHGMILTDDELDDEDEDEEELDEEEWRLSKLRPNALSSPAFPSVDPSEIQPGTPAPIRGASNTMFNTVPSKAASSTESLLLLEPLGPRLSFQKERNAMSALFVEDKPWRKGREGAGHNSSPAPFASPAIPRPQRPRRSLSNPLNPLKLLQQHKKSPRGKSLTEEELASLNLMELQNSNSNDDQDWSSDEHDDDEDEDEELAEATLLSSQLPTLDLNDTTDWSHLASMPSSFLGNGKFHSSMAHYLDDDLDLTETDSDRLVLEHSMLLRSIMQLLAAREGTQDWDDASLILKQGSLKKASRSGRARRIWRYKYVEIRQGFFSYYADQQNRQQSRQTIPLADCSIRPVNNNGKAFIFEIVSGKNKRQLWMTSSEEGRQSWLKILEEAKEKKPKKEVQNLERFQDSIQRYQSLQTNLRWSVNKNDYMVQFGEAEKLKLQLPLAWVPPSVEQLRSVEEEAKEDLALSVPSTADFWIFLESHDFVINGHTIPGGSTRSAERILGSVSRCILEYDRSSSEEHAQRNMTEAQALCYTREVLLSVCKSRSKDETYALLDELCRNPSLVIVLPASSDPIVRVNVTYTTYDDLPDNEQEAPSTHTISGWVTTRSKSFKNWKNRFCVVSDGVLSYYEQAQPRPHGLRGQLVLVGASINTFKEKHLFVLQIVTKDQERERQLSFRDESIFLEWKSAVQRVIASCSAPSSPREHQGSQPTSPQSPNRRRKNAGRILTNGGGRIISGVEGGFKAIKGASDLLVRGIRKSQVGRQPSMTSLETNQELRPKHDPPSVQISIQYDRTYRICSANPTGDGEVDTWMTVQTKTTQHFRLSGGENGRAQANDEFVLIQFASTQAGPPMMDDSVR